MEHPRRGLIGAVQDWARGSKANVVKILLRLTKWFGVQDEMREKLGVEQSRAAKLDKEIVDRAAAALQLLSMWETEEGRKKADQNISVRG